jgi:hypothetical protein
MKLVTFGDGRVGRVEEDGGAELDAASTGAYVAASVRDAVDDHGPAGGNRCLVVEGIREFFARITRGSA